MNQSWSELLVEPGADASLRLAARADGSEPILVSSNGSSVPIRNGIPRFIETETFTASFGKQWNLFEVRQPAEDEATFELKTGVRLADLRGLRVLDAGCGGGRYSLVAAQQGAQVIGVDRSNAVDKARQLCAHQINARFVQADLLELPLRPGSFDLVFSIGVLHHSPDAHASFASIARFVRPGGRLSVWLYRRNTLPQEIVNSVLRAVTTRTPHSILLSLCRAGALLGRMPGVNRTLNHIVPFSNHPRWENRVCDNFDWYSPRYQSHHTVAQVMEWFRQAGFENLEELPPARRGRLYRWVFQRGLLIGSGVNVTGIRKA